MMIVQEKEVHPKTREGCKDGFLPKNKDKKYMKDYLDKYNQKPEVIEKKRKYSRGMMRYYRHKPETNTGDLFADIGKYFDNFTRKKFNERLDEILKNNTPITEKKLKFPLLGLIYSLLDEKGILTADNIIDIYHNPDWTDAIEKIMNIRNYSKNGGEEYTHSKMFINRHSLEFLPAS